MTVMSMTGFARVDGADEAATWFWEIRAVNGRGLDVRLRLPQGAERIEAAVRDMVAKRVTRGNVNVQLTQKRTVSGSAIVVNETALGQILDVATALRDQIGAPPPTVEGLLGLRGVLESVEVEEADAVIEARHAAQLSDLSQGLAGLLEARSGEGRRLGVLVEDQLSRIADIVETVAASRARTADVIAGRLSELVNRLMADKSAPFDEGRLHQEAVLLATKADVEEELQRLRAHVAAARELLAAKEAVGRRP